MSIIYSGELELDKQIELWLKWDRNNKTLSEIRNLLESKNWTELRKRLLNRVTFGTAGLRACMRSGFDAMNDLVVIQTAQGLCKYICEQYPTSKCRKEKGIVFGYDGRYNSQRFAELSATVFIRKGVKVWLYGRLVATPFVPFAIMQKGCLAGVMVTASHNPKEDNGYKVYWGNGAQIISPHDKCIQKAIMEQLEPLDSSWDTDCLKQSPLVEDPFEEMFEAYNRILISHIPRKFLEINEQQRSKTDIRFVYTAMHGVGWPFLEKAFKEAKLPELYPVEEQKEADPEFPTVRFPNPEEGKSSLELAIKLADREGISMILANDPDADRLAYAEKDPETNSWKVFNGNELGALLGWWSIKNYQTLHPDVNMSDCYLLASTVSSKILAAIARKEGFHFIETLTGFKWMGNRAIELLEQKKHVLFAFEEAIGFMFSTSILDKDGISAATHLATMVCSLRTHEQLTLTQKLDEIYLQYGYHCTNCSYLFCDKPVIIQRIFERLRHYDDIDNGMVIIQNDGDVGDGWIYPQSILEGTYRIRYVRDLTTGVDNSQINGRAILPVSASNQMITFTFENGLVITLRTSGTEPKIKYYAELCAQPSEKDWPSLRHTLDKMVAAIVEEFLQPTLNDLKPKID